MGQTLFFVIAHSPSVLHLHASFVFLQIRLPACKLNLEEVSFFYVFRYAFSVFLCNCYFNTDMSYFDNVRIYLQVVHDIALHGCLIALEYRSDNNCA